MVKKEGTLSEQAYQQIKLNITHGKLRPGDLLKEGPLSEEVSISRTPIRAALQRLVYEGLAQTGPNKSVRVSQVISTDIEEITHVRRELEMLTIRLLKARASTVGFSHLRDLCNQEQTLAKQAPIDYLALIDIDYNIHVTLAELTGNGFLLDTMKRIKTKSNQYLILSGTMDKYGVVGVKEHETIVSFLEKGQFDYAEIAMRDHILHIGDRILK